MNQLVTCSMLFVRGMETSSMHKEIRMFELGWNSDGLHKRVLAAKQQGIQFLLYRLPQRLTSSHPIPQLRKRIWVALVSDLTYRGFLSPLNLLPATCNLQLYNSPRPCSQGFTWFLARRMSVQALPLRHSEQRIYRAIFSPITR